MEKEKKSGMKKYPTVDDLIIKSPEGGCETAFLISSPEGGSETAFPVIDWEEEMKKQKEAERIRYEEKKKKEKEEYVSKLLPGDASLEEKLRNIAEEMWRIRQALNHKADQEIRLR